MTLRRIKLWESLGHLELVMTWYEEATCITTRKKIAIIPQTKKKPEDGPECEV